MLDLIKGRGRKIFASSDAVIYLFNSYKFLGFGRPTKYRIPYFIYSAIITFFSVLCLPVLLSASLIRDRKILPITEILMYLSGSLNALVFPIKTMTMAFSMKRLRTVEEILDKLDKYYTKSNDQVIIKHCAVMGNRFVFGFAVMYATYASANIVTAYISSRVPYAMWIPYLDWRDGKREYYIQMSFDVVIVFFTLYHQALNDTYSAVYMYIIRTHLKLLRKRVERLGYDEKKSDNENYNELRECIYIHQNILKIASTVDPIISITLFSQFFVTAATLGVIMVNVVMFANMQTRIASSFYYIAVLMQTCPTCFQASYLLEDCDKLSLAIFHCNWAMQNKRFNNLLIYFLHRTQDQIAFYALKMVQINITTIVSIAKFSFTLYTFMQKMGLDEKKNG